ncbi:3-deoxy-manno-octulosonate-8-phosphatase KdsC [Candidatus Schneideria nysicola]|uniref:3-deoxy-manno-octulosonate-8-phosphatase KdsC n=1 Tax=Candidatus Schneideria nysicola TaxID=1081631 RepID=UPI001CAA539E|nr:3-deoxy-manno-octulosonate-8-phosphatase KdsC [Candidatus Schneideria nysicola]UAJ64835.1 3-deoxy-manno-octulosonate-8-phosphatase KdsC [Candidatus Schneideria nysicola]
MYENPNIPTLYGEISSNFLDKAENISLLICDVDGVLSDRIIYSSFDGNEIKPFHARDGYGIRSLLKNNIKVAIITGRTSKLLKIYCDIIGIDLLYQEQTNKVIPFNIIIEKLNLEKYQIAYIGDDLIDLPVMKLVGLNIAVKDAHPLVKVQSTYITKNNGGNGAIREICDLLLLAQCKLHEKYDSYLINFNK